MNLFIMDLLIEIEIISGGLYDGSPSEEPPFHNPVQSWQRCRFGANEQVCVLSYDRGYW